jgi:hypothetical protein
MTASTAVTARLDQHDSDDEPADDRHRRKRAKARGQAAARGVRRSAR